MSLFVTFEGVEGCGKSTQIRLLAQKLADKGMLVVLTREPGGCPIADAIRRVLLDPDHHGMTSRAELLLYAAARAQHVDEVILPALKQGKVVLCDRFSDATVAYQGYGRGLERQTIDTLNGLAAGGLTPDLTLLMDMPVEEGLGRAIARNDANSDLREGRFEQESIRFHQRVRDGYLQLAGKEDRFCILDATGSIEEVAARIEQAIDQHLGQNR